MSRGLERSFAQNVNVGNSGDRPVDGRSNGFELTVKPGSTVFRYDVEIKKITESKKPGPPPKEKILTKQSDTSVRTVQRQCCSDILAAFFTITNGFGSQCKYVYDGKAIMFATKEIKLPKNTTRLEASQMIERCAMFLRGDAIEVTILPNKETYRLDYSDLRACLVGDVHEQADRSVRMFFEMVTSQQLINENRYQMITAGTLFENRTVPLSDGRGGSIAGMEMRVGLKKGARVTDHKQVGPKAFIFVDMKRTAFFSTKVLSESYRQLVRNNNPRDFVNFFRGVRMQVIHDPRRTFLFGSLSQKNIFDDAYKLRETNQTIPEYMRTKGINVTLNAPGVHPDQPNGKQVIYPLESIRPLEGQLVPLEKLNVFAIRALLAENSILPQDRYNYCNQQFASISTGGGATFLAQFGLSFVQNSNVVKIHGNPMPSMTTGDARPIQPKPNGSWNDEMKNAKLLIPTTKLKSWYVAFDQRSCNEAAIRNYIGNLSRVAAGSGLVLPQPAEFIATNSDNLENVFMKAKNNKVQFIFYVDSDREKRSHGRLKLFEAYYKILTQHVVDKNLDYKPQTLKNVLLKLNVKAFGLNYTPSVSPLLGNLNLKCPDLLVIGYDIAPPAQFGPKEFAEYCKRHRLNRETTKINNIHPAAVGICANKGVHPYVFSGDLFYQEANGGLVDPTQLYNAVKQIVIAAFKVRPGLARVVVFRDGVSEGEQSQVMEQEFPSIQRGFLDGVGRTQETANMTAKITLVVATKMHSKRFYRIEGPKIFNTRAGDSIKGNSTRSDVKELFVQPHHPLKGMPKVPAFSVLRNDNEITDTQLEHFIIYLSNMHQVCACPTSLPLPVYMADEIAKRGEEIYKALRDYRYNQQNFAPEITADKEVIDLTSLNRALQYCGHPLYGTRFNA